MKNDRTRNGLRNIAFGFLQNSVQIVLPLIARTVIIYTLGIEYVGLNSFLVSVLSVLNLSELGIGTAMVFSMYKPIADGNANEICALMVLYRRYYRIIGLVILLLGLILLSFIPHLISGDVPANINIYYLYIIYLLNTVSSYWLFAYRNSLIIAYQRRDVVSKIQMIMFIAQFAVQLIVIITLKNFYIFTSVMIVFQIAMNIATALQSKKMFPQYTPSGKLPKGRIKEINKNIRDLFTAKASGIYLASVDTIFISSFLGLTTLAVYANYYYIMTAIASFVSIILTSFAAGIGNSIAKDSKGKLYDDFKVLAFIMFWVVGFCSICLLCLYQPAMRIWVGPEYMESMEIVVLFCFYFIVAQIGALHATYKDAGGIWRKDRFRPLVATIVGLILNLLLVQRLGLPGIIIATISTYVFISIPWALKNLFSNIFFHSVSEYLLHILRFIMCTALVGAFTYYLCGFIQGEGVGALLLKLLVCIIFSNLLFFLAYHKTNEYKNARKRVEHILRRKCS